jgi:hypothetical protein
MLDTVYSNGTSSFTIELCLIQWTCHCDRLMSLWHVYKHVIKLLTQMFLFIRTLNEKMEL